MGSVRDLASTRITVSHELDAHLHCQSNLIAFFLPLYKLQEYCEELIIFLGALLPQDSNYLSELKYKSYQVDIPPAFPLASAHFSLSKH